MQLLHLHLSPTHKTTHPSSSTHPYPHLHCHTRQWRSTRSLPMATKTMQVHLLLSGRQIAKTSSTTLGVASMRKGEPSIRCIATLDESPTSATAATSRSRSICARKKSRLTLTHGASRRRQLNNHGRCVPSLFDCFASRSPPHVTIVAFASQHDESCVRLKPATKATLLADKDICALIKSFPSKTQAKKNVSTIASFALTKGLSFSPAQKGPAARTMSPNENAKRHVRLAVDDLFSKMLPAFRQLPAFATAFSNTPRNGVALCSIDKEFKFQDFFLVLDSSIQVAMHASMRVVAMDGAHMPNLRKDLRLLVLEGVTTKNTIYTIAFMLCWGETIKTVGRFFDLLKEHRPDFFLTLGLISLSLCL